MRHRTIVPMALAVAVLALGQRAVPAVGPPPAAVFCWPARSEACSLPLPASEVAQDIAYDADRDRVLVVSREGSRLRVRAWSRDGRELGRWDLPQAYDAASVLFLRDGELRAWCSLVAKRSGSSFVGDLRRCFEVTFPAGQPPVVGDESYEGGVPPERDTALDPRTAVLVRRLMGQASFLAPPAPGLDVGMLRVAGPETPVHVRFPGHEPVGWSDDLAVVCFSWSDAQNATACCRQPDGSYRALSLAKPLRPDLGGGGHRSALATVSAFAVSGREIAIGGAQTSGRTQWHGDVPVVWWVRVVGDRLDVIRRAKGYLARPLRRY